MPVEAVFTRETGRVPTHQLPVEEIAPEVAYQIVHDELMLDGNARLNLATFLLFFLATLVASTGIAIFIDGVVIELGREFSFLVWSATQLFVMLSCPYYPIDAFPAILHPLIRLAPFYWVFDGVRKHLTDPGLNVSASLFASFLIAFGYLIVSIPLFTYFMNKARRTGRLSRM